jgi:hypothetical protein
MSLVFSVPYDFDSVRAAIAEVVRAMRWSHVYRCDDLIPGWCEWDLLDPLTHKKAGTIHLRKLGDGVRLSVPAVRDIANVLVPMLQNLGIPVRPREQLLALGRHEVPTRASQSQKGGRPGLEQEELVYRLKAALRARELRRSGKTWKEAAQELRWRYGWGQPGVKLLQDADQRLRRLESNDPDGLLTEVRART